MRRWRQRALVVVVACLAAACQTESADPSTTTSSTEPLAQPAVAEVEGNLSLDDIPTLIDAVAPSVVAVQVETPQGMGEGSGVIWSADGLIVTNNHVIANGQNLTVILADGTRVPAELVAGDPLTDLAVLRVDRTDLPAATFSDDVPQIGDLAVTVGNPLGFENTASLGIVSGVGRAIPSGGTTPALVNLIQTDAPISPGNSGGALVGGDGEVIGITVAYLPPQTGAVALGFAISAPTVTDVVPQLIEGGEVTSAFIGIRPAPVTPAIAERFGLDQAEGVVVLEVIPGSAAEEAGIQSGDILQAIDDTRLRTVEDLYAFLRSQEPGDEVTLTVRRGGEQQEITLTLTERPQN